MSKSSLRGFSSWSAFTVHQDHQCEKRVEHLAVGPHCPVPKPLLPCGRARGSLQAASRSAIRGLRHHMADNNRQHTGLCSSQMRPKNQDKNTMRKNPNPSSGLSWCPLRQARNQEHIPKPWPDLSAPLHDELKHTQPFQPVAKSHQGSWILGSPGAPQNSAVNRDPCLGSSFSS